MGFFESPGKAALIAGTVNLLEVNQHRRMRIARINGAREVLRYVPVARKIPDRPRFQGKLVQAWILIIDGGTID